MLKKLTTSVLLIFTFGGISGYGATGNVVDEDSMCDFDTFGSADGSFDLQANWTPNKINVHFHDDANGTTTTKTCTYNEIFDLPAKPTRTGYTFAGWRVQQTCGITNFTADQQSQKGINFGFMALTGEDEEAVQDYGISGPGDWAVEYNHGTIYGQASCNSTPGTYAVTTKSSETMTKGDTGQYCWCRIYGYTKQGNDYSSGPSCKTISASWVFLEDDESADVCAEYCTFSCLDDMFLHTGIRPALFNAVK